MNASTSIAAFAGRKLKEDETRLSTHVVRASVASLILVSTITFASAAGQTDAPGLVLLGTVVWVNVAAVMVTAFTFFTPVLAEERQSGTLSVLKLCSEGDGSVLAGLVLPRLSYALMLLAVQIPFAMLSVTLGGVTATQVVGCYWTLILSVIVLCSLCTCTATLTRSAGGATAGVISILVIGVFFASIMSSLNTQFSTDQWFAAAAGFPGVEIGYWMTGNSRPFFGAFFWSAVGQSTLALLIAMIAFRRSDATAAHEGETLATKARVWAARHRKFAPKDFKRGPHAWKDFHLVAGGQLGIIVRVVAYTAIPVILTIGTIIASALGTATSITTPAEIFAMSLGQVVIYVLPIDCAWLAARRIRLELDDNAWDLLELLPTSRQFVLAGKGTGTVRGLVPGLLLGLLSLFVAGAAQGADAAFAAVLFGGLFGGVMLSAILVAVWFAASHAALRFRAGTATGITILALLAVPLLFVLPMGLLGVGGVIVSMLLIPTGLGFLVAAITTFSNRFYRRALKGTD